MQLEWKTCPIASVQTVQETVEENPFDLEIQLPEWAPDLRHCLQCTVTPQIRAVNITADRANAEGIGVLRLLYCAEDGTPAVTEQTFPIRRSVPLPADAAQPQVRVGAETDYVNCRASGQRKAVANGVVSIRFTVTQKRETNILTDTAQPQICTQTAKMDVLHATAQTVRTFAMSEVVELGGQDPTIGGIVYSGAYMRTDSVRAVQDKLLVKGEAVTRIIYTSPQLPGEFASFTHTMPVSQVIEAPGVSEGDLLDVSADVVSARNVPKSDGNGDDRLLEIALQIQVTVRCFALTPLQVIEDAYSTAEMFQGTYTEMRFLTAAERWQDTVSVKTTLDLSGTGMQSVLFCTCGAVRQAIRTREDMLEVQCTAAVDVIGKDSEGEPVRAEKTLEFVCRRPLSGSSADVLCVPTVCITDCSVSILPDGTAQLQAEGFTDGMVYTVSDVRLLTEGIGVPLPEGQEQAAMTIYFADAAEPVWEIAKKYRTTVDAIRAENGLTEPVLGEKRMLVIPTAISI